MGRGNRDLGSFLDNDLRGRLYFKVKIKAFLEPCLKLKVFFIAQHGERQNEDGSTENGSFYLVHMCSLSVKKVLAIFLFFLANSNFLI